MISIQIGEKQQTVPDIVSGLTPLLIAIMVFVVILVFRRELQSAMQRISAVKAPGVEFTLAEKIVSKAEVQAEIGLVKPHEEARELDEKIRQQSISAEIMLQLKNKGELPSQGKGRSTIIPSPLDSKRWRDLFESDDSYRLRDDLFDPGPYDATKPVFQSLVEAIERLYNQVDPSMAGSHIPTFVRLQRLSLEGAINKQIEEAITGVLTIRDALTHPSAARALTVDQVLRAATVAGRMTHALDSITSTMLTSSTEPNSSTS